MNFFASSLSLRVGGGGRDEPHPPPPIPRPELGSSPPAHRVSNDGRRLDTRTIYYLLFNYVHTHTHLLLEYTKS